MQEKTVYISSITYTLPENVEEMYLIGTDNINGIGNSMDNYITGNDGNNMLDGGIGKRYPCRWSWKMIP
jgi:Ca2+-binding RTX toxin-like protein